MKTKLNKNYTKVTFQNEYEKVRYSDTSNAYDLARVGHYCGKAKSTKDQFAIQLNCKGKSR